MDLKVGKALLDEVTMATKFIMDQYGLRNSELTKNIEWIYKDDVFVLMAYDYFMNVAYGRRVRARKVPIEALIKWMKQKGITPKKGNYNQTAFAIQNSIYKNGIRERNYIPMIVETSTDILSEALAVKLSRDITFEVANAFSKIFESEIKYFK